MILHFHIHYRTSFGQNLVIKTYTLSEPNRVIPMHTYDGVHWTATIHEETGEPLQYKYAVIDQNNTSWEEWGPMRIVRGYDYSFVFIEDSWRSRDLIKNIYFSSAFTEVWYKRDPSSTISTKEQNKEIHTGDVHFQLRDLSLPSHYTYGIIGDADALGQWIKPIPLLKPIDGVWSVKINIDSRTTKVSYKYVILDEEYNIVQWEEGQDRTLDIQTYDGGSAIISTAETFNGAFNWRGAGLAIPIFSLRTEHSCGIGEFLDIKTLVDWAVKIDMRLIQILPVNDTIAQKSWTDSYPYAAISVFALNPLYINVEKVGSFVSKNDSTAYRKAMQKLNALDMIDFEDVLSTKTKYLQKLFEVHSDDFISSKEALNFVKQNSYWLYAYASFCHLRDINGTPDFNNWAQYSNYDSQTIYSFFDKKHPYFKNVWYYIFLQYHAHVQLLEAKNYARQKSIVLKGDLPIGIYRYSCDAWTEPHLYNMEEQAGAPPDDYAVLGQNWGFPTYNWQAMAQDDFLWWRKRMMKLNEYFDALRIDHILGFFRIWQIPMNQIQGTMGLFNPRLPISENEVRQYGLNAPLERYTRPFITEDILWQIFGEQYHELAPIIFELDNNTIIFRPIVQNQKQIEEYCIENTLLSPFKNALIHLMSEVLLIAEETPQGTMYNPRITGQTTTSYRYLDADSQRAFDEIYNYYYFRRHDTYWKNQALWKLPALLDASNMLICGEDLGMIPDAVPGVMKNLNIISLEIQRMPKGNTQFGMVSQYPYFSVCSPSCHDMSTIRGWWESDHDMAKNFYYSYLHGHGITPMSCTPEIVEAVVRDHLFSPSILAIFPIQDIIGMSPELRRENAAEEQINEPSNPKHYWRFRFHLNISDLLSQNDFNDKIKNLIKESGRK